MQQNIYANVQPLPNSYEARTLNSNTRKTQILSLDHIGGMDLTRFPDVISGAFAVCHWDAYPASSFDVYAGYTQPPVGVCNAQSQILSAGTPVQGKAIRLLAAGLGSTSGGLKYAYPASYALISLNGKPDSIGECMAIRPGETITQEFSELYVRGMVFAADPTFRNFIEYLVSDTPDNRCFSFEITA